MTWGVMHVKDTEVTQNCFLKLSLIRDVPRTWDARWETDLLQQLPCDFEVDRG